MNEWRKEGVGDESGRFSALIFNRIGASTRLFVIPLEEVAGIYFGVFCDGGDSAVQFLHLERGGRGTLMNTG